MRQFDQPPRSLEEVVDILTSFGIACPDVSALQEVCGLQVAHKLQQMASALQEALVTLDQGVLLGARRVLDQSETQQWQGSATACAHFIRGLLSGRAPNPASSDACVEPPRGTVSAPPGQRASRSDSLDKVH